MRTLQSALASRQAEERFDVALRRSIGIARVLAPRVALSLVERRATVLLDISPEDARERVLGRECAVTKFEEKNRAAPGSLEFMALVRATFLEFRDESFSVFDARLPSKTLQTEIVATIRSSLAELTSAALSE